MWRESHVFSNMKVSDDHFNGVEIREKARLSGIGGEQELRKGRQQMQSLLSRNETEREEKEDKNEVMASRKRLF